MTLWNLIPTCDNPMSCYTLVAFCIFMAMGSGVLALAYWWVAREFGYLNDGIKGHDQYIEETAAVINEMQIKLAVQQTSLAVIREDIAEIKALISNVNQTLMDMK